jgi:uncharacterized protein (DUF952 family)
MRVIYKICDAVIWEDARKKGLFAGAGIDLEDGFIHFSTASQVAETARRHFRNRSGLVLVAVATDGLDIIWEPSRGGDRFPHLYTVLPVASAISVTPLTCDDDGVPVPDGGYPDA